MTCTVLHELPGRMRVCLSLPRGFAPLREEVEGVLGALDGVRDALFNRRTGAVLVTYNGDSRVRSAVLKALEEMPLTALRRRRAEVGPLAQKRSAVTASGGMLLASPLVPLAAKPFLALWGGLPIFRKGFASLRRGRLNVDTLDASAVGAAIAMADYRTAGVISFLLKTGDYLDEWTRQRSRRVLSGMFQAVDSHAWVKRSGREERVAVEDIAVGDLVVARTGGRVAVDGTVAEGEALVNQASMTGEPMPVMKRAGLSVYAGTAVEEGTLLIRTARAGAATRVAGIIKVVEESERHKAEAQSRAEALADRIVPFSFLASALAYAFTGTAARAASVLLVDFSCAIKLSTPLTIMAGMVKAARSGVLIKGGRFVENLAKVDALVIDKTGTLTEAAPKVVGVVTFNGFGADYLLRHAACVEEHFPHPVATAVVQKAREEGLIHEEEHGKVDYVVAHGIVSTIGGKRILVGSRHFISEDEGIDTSFAGPVLEPFAARGYSLLYVAIERELAGVIAIEDPLRNEAAPFLRRLARQGLRKVVMLTGDSPATARTIAERLGITEYYAQALPDQKTAVVRKLKNEGYTVAMVGDGINDSPALSVADVGISLKHGAEIAKEASDVLLLDGDLNALLDARQICRGAMARIEKNYRAIVGVNSLLIGLGLAGAIAPALSALLHNTATIAVTLNSLSPLAKDGAAARCGLSEIEPGKKQEMECKKESIWSQVL